MGGKCQSAQVFREDFSDSHISSCSANQSMAYNWEPKRLWLLPAATQAKFPPKQVVLSTFSHSSAFYFTNAFSLSVSPTFIFICIYSTFCFLHNSKMTTFKSQLSKDPLCSDRKSCLKTNKQKTASICKLFKAEIVIYCLHNT